MQTNVCHFLLGLKAICVLKLKGIRTCVKGCCCTHFASHLYCTSALTIVLMGLHTAQKERERDSLFFTILMECIYSLWPNWKFYIGNGICYPSVLKEETQLLHWTTHKSSICVVQCSSCVTGWCCNNCASHLYCTSAFIVALMWLHTAQVFLYCMCETVHRV